MKLADKIIKLRKQSGWSQEELAEQMNVSRQSVSKWEGALSIPDLTKIIKLGEIFGVSTDYLLKDDIESVESNTVVEDDDVRLLNVREGQEFIELNYNYSKKVAKGVLLLITSIIPMLFLTGISEASNSILNEKISMGIGITLLFLMVAFGVVLLIGTGDSSRKINALKNEHFELDYGVSSILKEALEVFSPRYHKTLAICITTFIISPVPIILSGIFNASDLFLMFMVILLITLVAAGVYCLIPISAKFNAYHLLLKTGDYDPKEVERRKPIERFASFYWPLVVAIYVGWSLFTMDWGITWIVWPIATLLFAAIAGLISFVREK